MEETQKNTVKGYILKPPQNLKKSSMRCMKPSVRNKGIMDLVIYQ